MIIMSGHYHPRPDCSLMEPELSCPVNITLPHWLWGTMIILYTQSNEQETNKRWNSHKQHCFAQVVLELEWCTH